LILFLVVAALALVLLPGYVWWRMILGTTTRGSTRRWLTALAVLLSLSPIAADALNTILPGWVATPLEWVAYTWLGTLVYLFFALLALEPIRLVLNRRNTEPGTAHNTESMQRNSITAMPPPPTTTAGPGTDTEPVDATEQGEQQRPNPERGLFLARKIAVVAGAMAIGSAGTGLFIANSPPDVNTVPIAVPGLDPSFDGFRIVTISDVHLSSTYGARQFKEVIDLVNAQNPDIVAIVGDLVDGNVEELGHDAALLADLDSEQGIYFVTGNHEYYVDTEAWMSYLPTLGVTVLRNQHVTLRADDAALDLAGIDDRTAADSGVPGHGANLQAALAGRDTSRPVVLLAHQPAQVEQARNADVDLQLSGHTHGAQMWPLEYIVGLDQPLLEGLGDVGDTQLYVTRGTGYWGPAMRLGSRPEISVIDLHP
jgi:predicted MPP superfamily phosphohydrolase